MTETDKRSRPSGKYSSITGVNYATCCSGTKYKNRDDLLLIVLDSGSLVCGCFTLSTMPSAPVIWSKKTLRNPIISNRKVSEIKINEIKDIVSSMFKKN